MMIKVDKFFIAEMQDAGFDVDYNKLKKIYQKSRQRPDCILRKKRNMILEAEMDKIEMLILTAEAEEKKLGKKMLDFG